MLIVKAGGFFVLGNMLTMCTRAEQLEATGWLPKAIVVIKSHNPLH